MPKWDQLADFIWPVTGRHNLVLDDGKRWKQWRSAFNPGFSNAHLMSLLPDMVDTIRIFHRQLEKMADAGKAFRLEKFATRLTIDVIGKIVLDVNLNSQLEEHTLVRAFEESCRWLPVGAQYRPSELWDIRRPYIFWKNERIMNKYIDQELTKRWATRTSRGKSKYIVDLALDTYLKEKGLQVSEQSELDREFREMAKNQVRTFLFAGHETTSSAISYCLYYLSTRADVASKVRAEIDSVFGKDTDVGQRIKDEPALVNKLEYIMAVVKEVMRLQSPANSVRGGSKDFFIVDPKTGEKVNTEDLALIAVVAANHHHRSWGDPYAFRPERWLEKDVFEGAFIPFSKGPRNCIGQELALIEVRIVIAMVFRDLDFKACYDELEALKDDDTLYTSESIGEKEMWECEAYQMGDVAKPREGMPIRVTKRVAD